MQQNPPQQINDIDKEVEFQCMEIENKNIPAMLLPYMPPRKQSWLRSQRMEFWMCSLLVVGGGIV